MTYFAARKLASELRQDLELADRYLDLDQLLRDMGITVIPERPVGTAEAMSLCVGGRDHILVDPAVSDRRKRFTLGHELGHILLAHGACPCTPQSIHGMPGDPYEAAANEFSANLLMPIRLFRRDAKTHLLRVEDLSKLADQYGVSLTATAIRFTEVTRDACAVVGLRVHETPWISKSRRNGWWIHSPDSVEAVVEQGACDDIGNVVVRESPAEKWLEGFSWGGGEWFVREEIVRTGSASFLVLLSELPDADDDPTRIDREAEAELGRRRKAFRRY